MKKNSWKGRKAITLFLFSLSSPTWSCDGGARAAGCWPQPTGGGRLPQLRVWLLQCPRGGHQVEGSTHSNGCWHLLHCRNGGPGGNFIIVDISTIIMVDMIAGARSGHWEVQYAGCEVWFRISSSESEETQCNCIYQISNVIHSVCVSEQENWIGYQQQYQTDCCIF